MSLRLDKLYDKIEEMENSLEDAKRRKQSLETNKIFSDNIYKSFETRVAKVKLSIQIIRTRKEGIMNINTLNILADTISEVGSWHWWFIKDDMVQVQFCDIMLYDEAKLEKETHTTDVLAVRFYGHAFAVFFG